MGVSDERRVVIMVQEFVDMISYTVYNFMRSRGLDNYVFRVKFNRNTLQTSLLIDNFQMEFPLLTFDEGYMKFETILPESLTRMEEKVIELLERVGELDGQSITKSQDLFNFCRKFHNKPWVGLALALMIVPRVIQDDFSNSNIIVD